MPGEKRKVIRGRIRRTRFSNPRKSLKVERSWNKQSPAIELSHKYLGTQPSKHRQIRVFPSDNAITLTERQKRNAAIERLPLLPKTLPFRRRRRHLVYHWLL